MFKIEEPVINDLISTKYKELKNKDKLCEYSFQHDVIDLNRSVDINTCKFENITLFLENLSNSGKNYSKFLEDVIAFLKDLILYKKNVSKKLIKVDERYLSYVSDVYSLENIFYVVDMINQLIDKIKFVSRQSVVVISNFLLISNNLSSDGDNSTECVDIVQKNDYDLAFSFTSSENREDDSLPVSNVTNSEEECVEVKDNVYINKDIIINNAFALADKQLKFSLQEKWKSVNDYLTDNHFAIIAGKFVDVNLEVAGGNYIICTVKYDSLVEFIYSNYKLSSDFMNVLLDGEYRYVVITVDEWNKYRNEYINNLKNGKKYEIISLLDEKNIEISKKEPTAVDMLFDIVGEENIEFK